MRGQGKSCALPPTLSSLGDQCVRFSVWPGIAVGVQRRGQALRPEVLAHCWLWWKPELSYRDWGPKQGEGGKRI